MVDEDIEDCSFVFFYPFGLAEHRHRPVVDRVVKTGAGQHEAIQQGHTDTGGLSIQQRVQHLILQMSMQIEGIANSHVGIG